jgi:hypothetical protein
MKIAMKRPTKQIAFDSDEIAPSAAAHPDANR